LTYKSGKVEFTITGENQSMYKTAKNAAAAAARSLGVGGGTTREKISAINRYIVRNCAYDYDAASTSAEANKEPFTAYGAIINGKAVCSGISRLFMLMCEELNVPCIYVSSPGMNHGWNAVYCYGETYYVDVTYNLGYSAGAHEVSESYLMLDEQEIKVDHSWDSAMINELMSKLYSKEYAQAQRLFDVGLFRGTATGYSLDKTLTRAEAATMLTRLLGAEEEALRNNYKHPFTDVPDWASAYVGYLYKNKLTKGVSSTLFASNRDTTLNEYVTFVLRALAYREENGDFVWSSAGETAVKMGFLTTSDAARISKSGFDRGDMVLISTKALSSNIKGTQTPMIEHLISVGAVKKTAAREAGF